MKETQPASRKSSKALVTAGQLVEGFRAKYYDIGNTPLGLPFVTRPHVRLILLQPGQSLLDVGCGTGEVLYQLHRKFGETVSLHGIDPSEDMLDVARQKLQKASNAVLELGIGEQLQFPEASFDWVVSSLTFHHVPLEVKRATICESCRRQLTVWLNNPNETSTLNAIRTCIHPFIARGSSRLSTLILMSCIFSQNTMH